MVQAEHVAASLTAEGIASEIVPITTSGDEGATTAEGPSGLKGLWIDSILQALRGGRIDLAVHSAKDLPAEDDEDLAIGAVPERADPRDLLVWRDGGDGELRNGVVVGTSSLRRRAQLLATHPRIEVRDLRGNVDTRLRKLAEGEVDLAVLATAGLSRLGITPANARPLGIDEMLPAPGQGALAIQCRADARDVAAVLVLLDHRASRLAVDAERALTRLLGGGCALPFGALAAVHGETIRLAAVAASPDGTRVVRAAAESADPVKVAQMVAAALHDRGAGPILDAVRRS
jgi:hydroxymethylbilane synthase